MTLHTVFRLIGTALPLLVGAAYFYQILYLFIPFFRKKNPPPAPAGKRYGVLIAARNEEAVLPYLLDSIAAQTYPSQLIEVYVIADNCTDGTAAVVEAHGAVVFQRFNQKQVGKGYALEFLFKKLKETGRLNRCDAFLIFDADNLLEPDYIAQINRLCQAGYPAFCGYRGSKNYGDSWLSAGCGLMYLHESIHLNQSRMLLGTTCAVSGTGFGFTRQLLEDIGGWPFHTLTEDIEFSTWCATRGIKIGYCPEAILYDEQTSGIRQSVRQRLRWMRGGVQVSLRYAGDLLRGLARGGRTAWSCFELITCSLWGYGISILSCLPTLITLLLSTRGLGVGRALLATLLGTYGSFLLVGGLTTLLEWKRIPCPNGKKLRYLFTYPLFMMTFVPIGLAALFFTPQWKPIAHTVAISNSQLKQGAGLQ